MPTKLTAAQKEVIRKMKSDEMLEQHQIYRVWHFDRVRVSSITCKNLMKMGLIEETGRFTYKYQLTTIGKTIEL